MKDSDCVEFMQWALPQMGMRWPGFRKVRRQVCRRISVRLEELHIAGLSQYKTYLKDHPEEWNRLDAFCRITISRFYRDKSTFDFLKDIVMKTLVKESGKNVLRFWSCGCASGEEPYTLSLIWHRHLKPEFPDADIEIIATDSFDSMIDRALSGSYTQSSLKNLSEELLQACFSRQKKHYVLNDEFRSLVQFIKQDVRDEMPEGQFQLILCRYLVFTYFDEKLQEELLDKIISVLAPGGALVLGKIDRLPCITEKLEPWSEKDRIYRKVL